MSSPAGNVEASFASLAASFAAASFKAASLSATAVSRRCRRSTALTTHARARGAAPGSAASDAMSLNTRGVSTEVVQSPSSFSSDAFTISRSDRMSLTAPEAARLSATNAASARGWRSSASVGPSSEGSKASAAPRAPPFGPFASTVSEPRRRDADGVRKPSVGSPGDARVAPNGAPSESLPALPRRRGDVLGADLGACAAPGARAKVGSPAESVAESVNARLGSAGSLIRAGSLRRAEAEGSASEPLSGANREQATYPAYPRSPAVANEAAEVTSSSRRGASPPPTSAFHRAAPPSNSFS